MHDPVKKKKEQGDDFQRVQGRGRAFNIVMCFHRCMHVCVCRTYSYDKKYESAVIAFIKRYRHLVNVCISYYMYV